MKSRWREGKACGKVLEAWAWLLLTVGSSVVLYTIKLRRASNDAERQAIEAEMSANPKLRPILNELQGKQEKAKTAAAYVRWDGLG